jgi:hypothetical protein
LTCTKKEAKTIKAKIAEFLLTFRKLRLNDEKTKITFVSEGYKFLGFEIRMRINNHRFKRVVNKDLYGKYSRPLKRTTSRQLTIEPDKERLLKRLKMLKVCNAKYEPIGKASWLVYNTFQIVQKYNKIFKGIFNYYKPCERYNRLYQISYILQYSCAKTLARRKKVSMTKIFKLYNRNLGIKKIIKSLTNEIIRYTEFTDLTSLIKRKKQDNIENFTPIDRDPFRIQEHWRTKFKIYNECCMCGETDSISLHHLNSIRSIKNKDKFEAIRSQIKRIQIPVCHKCHQEITHGRYNDQKTPIEFYNEFLAKL